VNASEFNRVLTVTIPKHIQDRGRQVFFDVGSQLDEAIADETPVDTGYLRSSRAFTAGSEAPPALEPKDPHQSYRSSQPQSASALLRAVRDFIPFTTGFRADYASYVEDNVGMVKNAFAQAGRMIRTAVANARASTPR
jgi:hypothetical protein